MQGGPLASPQHGKENERQTTAKYRLLAREEGRSQSCSVAKQEENQRSRAKDQAMPA